MAIGDRLSLTKSDSVLIYQSIPLVTQTLTTAEYNNALALSNELLGIEEEEEV
jgi:hypothetical protein